MSTHSQQQPIAIVIPWFGKDLKGGAEQLTWQIATRLAKRNFQIDVLTTCCRSHLDDWGTNHLKAGVFEENGVIVRRFPVNLLNQQDLDRLYSPLLHIPKDKLRRGVLPVSLQEAESFKEKNINSDELLIFLKNNKTKYKAFLFIPYLYGPILNGLPLVAERAYLQPCLHDEIYAYLPAVEHIFRLAQRILYNSEGEARLAEYMFGPGINLKGVVIGSGVEVVESFLTENLNHVSKPEGKKFILYAGNRQPFKNTDFLVACFEEFKHRHPQSKLHLVLIGPGEGCYENYQNGISDLGLVSEEKKYALFTSCIALINPSVNESFSRVMMEAWFCGKPVAVHGDCLATALAVEKSGGGWTAGSQEEWIELFQQIDTTKERELERLGKLGLRYARSYADWDQVIARYETEFRAVVPSDILFSPSKRKLKAIHQILPNLVYGDAISNHARTIRNYLQSQGFQSEIYVRYLDPQLTNEAKIFGQNNDMRQNDGLIYHHSIGFEFTAQVLQHRGPKCLIYHNITPAHFFELYKPDFAKILKQGREELRSIVSHFPLAVAESSYNVEELKGLGCTAGILPLVIDPGFWNFPSDPGLMRQLQDGRTNIIFVGRIAPNKRQDHLIESFIHYKHMDPEARLFLIGRFDVDDPYYLYVDSLLDVYQLRNSVFITGLLNDAQLQAYYRTAHLYWSMSEHEGFGVPLIEAMWFDTPVLAYKSTAVPETLGDAAFLFTEKQNFKALAALAQILIKDREIRKKILVGQRKRREKFLPENIFPILDDIIQKIEEQS